MDRLTRTLPVMAALGLLLAVAPVSAEEDAPAQTVVTLDDVVQHDGDLVTVNGTVRFGVHGVASPAPGGGGEILPAELGGEFAGASISSDPESPGTVEFAVQLTSLPPGGGVPEVVIYGWDLRVDGSTVGEGDSSNLEWRRMNVTGSVASGQAEQSLDEFIVVRSCVPNPDTGGSTCGAGPRLAGAFDADADELRATVPVGEDGLLAEPGSVVNRGSQISVYHGTGLVWAPGVQSDAMFFLDDFVIPDRTDSVALAIVAAGEPAPDAFDVAVTPAGEGAEGEFETELDTSALDAGAYDVVARACWGANCGETRIPFTPE